MAELASGAVSSLLGLLQKEARLLGGIGNDVEFIREEMESMNSFLEYLSMTAHLTGGHNKQVRTWMKQVRELAHDCSNCIDNYVRSGDLGVHRARGGLRRYAWWTYWLVQKMVDQHRAAMRLRELKDRVSDVGKRRLRYGVEIPGKAARGSAQTSTPSRGVAEDEDDDDDTLAVAGDSDPLRRAMEPCALEDFYAEKLLNRLSRAPEPSLQDRYLIPSIGIVAPDADTSAAAAQVALDFAATHHFQERVSINLKALHHKWDLPLLPQEILCYILRECKKQRSTGQGKMEEKVYSEAQEAFRDKTQTCSEIWGQIEKLIDIKLKFRFRTAIEKSVHELMVQVSSKKTEETKRSEAEKSSEEIMQEAAKKIKTDMETVLPALHVWLDETQYLYILQKVFSGSKSPQVQETTNNIVSTLGDDHIKEILNNHRIALDIIRELLLSWPQPSGDNSLKERAKGVLQSSRDPYSATDAAITETKKEMDEPSGEIKANSTTGASEETREKVDEILRKIYKSMLIKGIVDKIKEFLKTKRTLIILIDDRDYISNWEGIRDALSLLPCTNNNAVVVITQKSDKAKEFCCTPGGPINYSLVGLYHHIVLEITKTNGE